MDRIRDFDWSARLALSSDKKSQLNEPVLHLKIDTERNGKISERSMELGDRDVKLLLTKLVEARKALD
jgi:hypothetical protein